MRSTIGDAITIVLFGRVCDPINLDKSRVAMGLYFPCQRSQNIADILRRFTNRNLFAEASRIIEDIVHDVSDVFFSQEFAKFRHYWTVPS